jgi:glyoxylate reductase
MKVVVSQPIFPEALELLRAASLELDLDHSEPGGLSDRLEDADGLICLLTDTVDAELLSAAPRLRVVSNVAVGYNNIDVKAATERGVLVTNTPNVLDDATADLAFALLLAAARRIPEAERYLRRGAFKGWELFQPHLGLELAGKTLGLVGLGRIGQAVARRARGFDMDLVYHKREPLDAEAEAELGARYLSFGALLEQSDFISVHTPLTQETRHMFSRAQFARMKPNAILVNTARGPVVDEVALAEALKAGVIRGAALDVFEEEPQVHPALLELEEHVVLVPHIGSATYETRTNMSLVAARNMVAGLSGKRPPDLVNPEAWAARAQDESR